MSLGLYWWIASQLKVKTPSRFQLFPWVWMWTLMLSTGWFQEQILKSCQFYCITCLEMEKVKKIFVKQRSFLVIVVVVLENIPESTNVCLEVTSLCELLVVCPLPVSCLNYHICTFARYAIFIERMTLPFCTYYKLYNVSPFGSVLYNVC